MDPRVRNIKNEASSYPGHSFFRFYGTPSSDFRPKLTGIGIFSPELSSEPSLLASGTFFLSFFGLEDPSQSLCERLLQYNNHKTKQKNNTTSKQHSCVRGPLRECRLNFEKAALIESTLLARQLQQERTQMEVQ